MKTLVTCWYRDKGYELPDGSFDFEFNHISTGYHPDNLEPAPVTHAQASVWSMYEWRGVKGWIENGVVMDDSVEVAKALRK